MHKYCKAVVEKVEQMVEQLLEGTELELIDVEYIKEQEWHLRVFIDKDGGIDIDDCTMLSEKLEKLLDEEDLILNSYQLEVSSPGLNRILKKERDLVREQGKAVEVTLYKPLDGVRLYRGILNAFDDETLTVDNITLPRENIAQVRLYFDF